MQPVRVRTAGRGRPALVTGVFLLVASLVLLVSPLPTSPDARSTSPTSRSLADVLVQGDGVAAAVAAAGGRSLAALPIVGGLLARVPGDRAEELSSHPGVRAVVDMRRECTDLAEAARRATADWLRGPESRLELELPAGPLEVDADPLRLVQVLANLISNAHKYSPTDQEVRLRVWRDNGWALAAVADRGRGIPREELDRVFEKFHRVEDPMTMTTGGTGLGLYIARELTRAMGGEIETTSALRRGSTFTVRPPTARSREGGEDAGAPGRDRGDDTQPPRTKARRLPDPLCRSS